TGAVAVLGVAAATPAPSPAYGAFFAHPLQVALGTVGSAVEHVVGLVAAFLDGSRHLSVLPGLVVEDFPTGNVRAAQSRPAAATRCGLVGGVLLLGGNRFRVVHWNLLNFSFVNQLSVGRGDLDVHAVTLGAGADVGLADGVALGVGALDAGV